MAQPSTGSELEPLFVQAESLAKDNPQLLEILAQIKTIVLPPVPATGMEEMMASGLDSVL